MNPEHPAWWDPYSSQPYKLPKNGKSRLSPENLLEYSKIFGTTLGLLPALLWKYISLKRGPAKNMQDFAGLSINSDPQWQNAHQEMIEEIGVKNLLLRVPVWQLEKLDEIEKFVEKFPTHNFLINILQYSGSVENPDQWRDHVQLIFDRLSPRCTTFKIANAVNRSKWGCKNSGEALELFRIASEVRSDFPNIKLLGSSVIDFEPMLSLRTLYNFKSYQYDGCASLLYINRRGSVYGKQYRYFNLERKIKLNKTILELSNNTKNELWITETNWPLVDTKPYTPNSGNPRSTVDEQTQANYLKQYFEIANNTGWVERVYWWQLINPGYGLVDHRQGRLRKMPSYFAFKSLFG